MKSRILVFLTILATSVSTTSTYSQKTSLPKWIEGTWHNTFKSNTNKSVFFTFRKDSIFIGKGLMGSKSNSECLNTTYKNYDKVITASPITYSVSFIKKNNTVDYRFKLNKVSYTEKPVLTYVVTINGIKKMDGSNSINLVLTKF